MTRHEFVVSSINVLVSLGNANLAHLHTESDSNVLRIAATAAWFSDALVDFNCSTENRQFLY